MSLQRHEWIDPQGRGRWELTGPTATVEYWEIPGGQGVTYHAPVPLDGHLEHDDCPYWGRCWSRSGWHAGLAIGANVDRAGEAATWAIWDGLVGLYHAWMGGEAT